MSDKQTAVPQPVLVKVKGTLLREHTAQQIDAIAAFRPHPSDLLIASYPKSGTTWTQEIVDLLLHNGDVETCRRATITRRNPFFELSNHMSNQTGLELLKEMEPPRVIKTHLPFHLAPAGFWENKCKAIYVARNAKDTLVSYYYFHHMNKAIPEPGPWEDFVHKFMHGELLWGSWYDHVKGFWEEREKKNILFLFYEDMHENPRREVERIMNYLDLSLSDEVLNRVVKQTSFKNMKENPMVNYTFVPKEIFDQSTYKFMRKGVVGDWENHFTPEQSAEFDDDYEKKMKDVNMPFRMKL
ncbi:sulfotransferase 1C1-like [Corythoichthys intestinalis]|uniref:sulfotransferase 1C1-like n=1 Tax=Corythoichthys intestinalis TaxID=161448 RepID=UPI0025A6737C|nr:sulfotransferase 1C1-like [Corythoichthys intestinalis]XP_061807509.1 sulfotransferase 1C1-like [Nerophis lumbriciformis]